MTEQEAKRFKELFEKKKSQRLDAKEFKEFKTLENKAKKLMEDNANNDFSWWNKYPHLTKDVVNFVFNYIAGAAKPFGGQDSASIVNGSINIPGVVRVNVLQTIGYNETNVDAFNAQIRKQWLAMHRKYRGIGTYQQADLGIAEFAVLDVFRQIARAERVYGVISLFSAENRNIPYALLDGLHVDQTAAKIENLANFRLSLNRLIERAGSLCLPKGMSAFDDAITLMSIILKDSNSVRASCYLYDTFKYVKYEPTTYTTGGSLRYVDYTMNGKLTGNIVGSAQTLDDIISDISAQIDALLSDDDIARICSDVLAAFKENNTIKLLPVPEDYKVIPVRNDERLEQFHNISLHPNLVGVYSVAIYNEIAGLATPTDHYLDIVQENDVVKQRLTTADTSSRSWHQAADGKYYFGAPTNSITVLTGSNVLDSWSDDVSDEMKCVMTRMHTVLKSVKVTDSGTDFYCRELVGFGLHVPETIEIFQRASASSNYTRTRVHSQVVGTNTGFTTPNTVAIFRDLLKLDWHPIIYLVTGLDLGNGVTVEVAGDLNNPTVISGDTIKALHDVACYSAFKLDSISDFDSAY